MRTPARAIAWEFRRRHRWGLIAIAGYLLVLGTIRLLVLEPAQPIDLDDSEGFAFTVIVPLTSAFLYLLAVFSFGSTGDLAARRSLYPTRMFTLPVSTGALAGWPMLYGTVSMAGLWLATALLAVRPSGVDVPLIWPALFAAAFLTWTQALMWMPYGLPGLRVIVAVVLLVAMDTVALLAIHYQPAEPLMVALIAPQLPLAYLAARFAVRRARRGDVPDWRAAFALPARGADAPPRRRDRFLSPAAAQLWFEWRLHGRSLPGWVAILLPFELAFLFIPGAASSSLAYYTLCGVLLTPPVMAAFAGPRLRTSGQARDSYGLAPFTAALPLTSAALIAAKMSMTIRSTLAAWLLVLVATPVALTLSGTWPVVVEPARLVSVAVGTPRAIAVALLLCAALMAATWKQQVQSLYIGLSGRAWLIKASTFVAVVCLTFVEPLAQCIHGNDAVRAALWDAVRWVPAVLVGVKLVAAGWVATRLYQTRLLSDRTLVTGAACWLAAVLALYGVLVWLVFTPHVPRYFLLLLAILAIPLARLSAAPLALAWNRHR